MNEQGSRGERPVTPAAEAREEDGTPESGLPATARDLIWLVRCAADGIVPDPARAAAADLHELYRAARKHMLDAAVGMALQSAGIRDENFVQAVAKAQRKRALLDADRAALIRRLEEAGIWYMPLKGAVLQDLYPAYGMRQMSDNDILVDPARTREIRDIMKSLGFRVESFGRGNEDVYIKPPVSSFEIHNALFRSFVDGPEALAFRDVKSRLVKDEGNRCGWHFTPEDFYLYLLVHAYKHQMEGGTGLRTFLDFHLYLRHAGPALDIARVEAEADELGIGDFARRSRGLATHFFGGEPLTDDEGEFLDYVMDSGAFGTSRHRIDRSIAEAGGVRRGKLRYLLGRLVLPMAQVKVQYPRVYQSRVLIPLVPVIRVGRAVFRRRRAAVKELRALMEKTPPEAGRSGK